MQDRFGVRVFALQNCRQNVAAACRELVATDLDIITGVDIGESQRIDVGVALVLDACEFVDGDGYADVMVGGRPIDASLPVPVDLGRDGEARLYYGGATGPSTTFSVVVL